MDSFFGLRRRPWVASAALFLVMSLHSPAGLAAEDTFSQSEVMQAAENFFGVATKGLAQVVQKVFDDLGEPNAFITGGKTETNTVLPPLIGRTNGRS